MTTLDAPNSNVDQRDVPFFQTALRYGVIGGMATIILSLIVNIFNLSDPTGGFTPVTALISLLSLGLYVAIGVLAGRTHRDQELGGYMTYGRGFTVAFVALLIMGLIGGIFSFVYMNYIDPGMVDGILEATAQAYEDQGLSAAQTEAAMSWVEWAYSPTMMIVFNVLVGPVFISALFALIIGAAVKKNPPHTA